MEENNEKASPDTGTPNLLSTLISNPESLSKIGQIISNFTDKQNGGNSPQNEENQVEDNKINGDMSENSEGSEKNAPLEENSAGASSSSALPDFLSLLTSQKSDSFQQNKQQIALLLAIRPYLSENRRQLIDSFIQFSKLSEILKKLL